MSSRSNARKSALQILFSYEFELTSIVKDHLEILCPHIIEMGFADQLIDHYSSENDAQTQSTFKMIETRHPKMSSDYTQFFCFLFFS